MISDSNSRYCRLLIPKDFVKFVLQPPTSVQPISEITLPAIIAQNTDFLPRYSLIKIRKSCHAAVHKHQIENRSKTYEATSGIQISDLAEKKSLRKLDIYTHFKALILILFDIYLAIFQSLNGYMR